jgi:hypothetical protein
MKRLHEFVLTLLTISAAQVASASDIILLLEADNSASIIAHVDPSDPTIFAAAPVLDAEKAHMGWMWTEYTTIIEGYVPTVSLSKNFDIAPDTIVRSNPNKNAHVLTMAEATDQFEVLSSREDWATVRFKKAIPVYFLKSAQTAAKATITAAQALSPASQPKYQSSIHFNPDGDASNLAPGESPPGNITSESAPATFAPEEVADNSPIIPGTFGSELPQNELEAIMVMPTEVQASEIPRSPEVIVGTPTRILTGKLVREIHNFGPRYPLRLKSSSGQRIAYVDMSRIFINDLRPYMDRKVYIRGEVHPIVPGSSDLVILARTIRITE